MSDDGRANLLGEYLRARRALVTPEEAGIPAGANRRSLLSACEIRGSIAA